MIIDERGHGRLLPKYRLGSMQVAHQRRPSDSEYSSLLGQRREMLMYGRVHAKELSLFVKRSTGVMDHSTRKTG